MIEQDADTRRRTAELLPMFLETVVLAWTQAGPVALTGPWAGKLPMPGHPVVHVITAAQPNGVGRAPAADLAAHAGLLRLFGRWPGPVPAPSAWWPAAGTSIDSDHTELSIAVAGLTRARAVDLGRQLDQLAVFELSQDEQIVVPCDKGLAPLSAERDRWALAPADLTLDDLDRWWDEHVNAATIADIALPPQPTCGHCGSSHLAEILYGMPMGPPPPWMELGGCTITSDQPDTICQDCGRSPVDPEPTHG